MDDIWQLGFDSVVSPDGGTFLVTGSKRISGDTFFGFWNIPAQELVSVSATDVDIILSAWNSPDSLTVVIQKTDSNDSTNYYLGYINRLTGLFSVEQTPLPVSGRILAMAPGATKLLFLEPAGDASLNALGEGGPLPTFKLPLDGMCSEDCGQQFLEITTGETQLTVLDLTTLETQTVYTLPTAI